MNGATSLGALTPRAFEERYRRDPDPWRFASSQYERDRYRSTLAALTRGHYAHAYEPACSIGELTVQLAQICARVSAADIAPTAVARARRRCAHLPHVEIACADLSPHAPPERVDLIVLSECGYYFRPDDLIRIVRRMSDALLESGEFVAVHWLGRSDDHVLHGDAVHSLLLAHLPLRWIKGARHDGFRIDSWLCA
jgi:trans-aconitate methyltransferase